jgi:two-component system NtrC family response regulator
MIAEERFRQDLYYRVSEITIPIPPVRDREGDALVLARAFIEKFNKEYGKSVRGFSGEAMAAIESFSWPGNVREIESRVKKAVIMADGTQISPEDLDLDPPADEDPLPLSLQDVREAAESMAIRRALTLADGNVSRAAKFLGITRPTLYNLMDKYTILPR